MINGSCKCVVCGAQIISLCGQNEAPKTEHKPRAGRLRLVRRRLKSTQQHQSADNNKVGVCMTMPNYYYRQLFMIYVHHRPERVWALKHYLRAHTECIILITVAYILQPSLLLHRVCILYIISRRITK